MRRRDTILVDRRGLVCLDGQGTLARRPTLPRQSGASWRGQPVGIQGEYEVLEAIGQLLSMLVAGALMAVFLVGGIAVQATLGALDKGSRQSRR